MQELLQGLNETQESASEQFNATLNGSIVAIQNLNHLEKESLEKLKPILEGEELYRKSSSNSSLQKQAFDPLEKGATITPEQKGFGKRKVLLDPVSL